MPTTFSPEIKKFITEQLKTGKYEDKSVLISEALKVFQELVRCDTELRDQIQRSLEDRKAGRVSPLDVEEIITELEAELDEADQSQP